MAESLHGTDAADSAPGDTFGKAGLRPKAQTPGRLSRPWRGTNGRAALRPNRRGVLMFFFFSLLPATLWAIVGYFVLVSAVRTEGSLRTAGQILAVWVFGIAAFFVLAGIYASVAGFPGAGPMDWMHRPSAPGLRF
jgi:hypothetical protein